MGLTSKVRRGASKRTSGGRSLGRGYIHYVLSNPLYAGRIPHNGDSYEGQHPAIVNPETWDEVQKRLAAQAPSPAQVRRSSPSPLRGKLFDEAGVLLTPSHTVKSGRRYRYYISRNSPRNSTAANVVHARSARWRLPAREIERAIGDAVVALFASPVELVRAARESRIHEARVPDLLEGVRRWGGKPLELVRRVDLRADEMAVHVDLSRILGEEGTVVRYAIPTRIRRRGVEMRLVLHGREKGSSDASVDPALVKAIVRGRKWFEDLASGRAQSLVEIAKANGVSDRYVGHLIPLAFLAPELVARILSGTQPVDLTTEALTKRIDLPLAWAEQAMLLGFDCGFHATPVSWET